MKLSKLKIDGLFTFYVLSIGLLGISWKYGLVDFSSQEPLALHASIDFDKNTSISYLESGEIDEITVLNPAMDIYCSTNGGDDYIKVGPVLRMSDVTNKDISNVPASVRWKPNSSTAQNIKSLNLFLVSNKTNERSHVKHVSSVPNTLQSIPVVSISTSEKGLLDPVEGLLVPGKHSWSQTEFQAPWYFREANFTQRGSKWEREVRVQFFEEGEMKEEAICGMRISGNATRGFPQKSLRLNARTLYGQTKFKTKILPKDGNKKHESLVFRMSGNDNMKTMFADLLMQRLAGGSEVLTQKGSVVRLYINGNYWGVYNCRERIDEYFVAKYEGGKKRDVTIIEDGEGELKEGSEQAQEEFLNLVGELRDLESIDDMKLEYYSSIIDFNSYMDYIFFESYYANNDWPANNAMCYQVDGSQWKWLLNDLDYSLAYPGSHNLNTNMFDKIKNSGSVHAVFFNTFMTNEKWKSDFKERCTKNLQKYLSEERIRREYDELKGIYAEEIDQQIKRWRNIESVEEWEANCEANLQFLLNRNEVFIEQLNAL